MLITTVEHLHLFSNLVLPKNQTRGLKVGWSLVLDSFTCKREYDRKFCFEEKKVVSKKAWYFISVVFYQPVFPLYYLSLKTTYNSTA